VCVSASRSALCRLLPHTGTTSAMRAHSPVLRTAPASLLLPKTRREDHAAESESSSISRPLMVRVHRALQATHGEEHAGNVIHFQPMSNPAAARSSTFNPCRTLRRRHAPLSTHNEPSGCTAPICVRRPSSTSVPSLLSGPFRASRGRSPGATVAPPPGMGWTLRTGISPRGPPKVARGEVPKVLDCRTTDSFWVPFWYPFFNPTCTQFYKKYQNGVPKNCQKGGGLLPQQSPNNPPQQSPPKPI